MLKPAVERHLAWQTGEPGEFCKAGGSRRWLLSSGSSSSGLCRDVCLERSANDLHMIKLVPLPPHHLLLH